MELHDALAQISEIRLQMARTELFRGYRAVPVAFSGVLAGAAAVVQALWLPEPTANLSAYLTLWIGTALIAALAAGVEMAYRIARTASPLRREMTWLAVSQFLPCLAAGALLTAILVNT